LGSPRPAVLGEALGIVQPDPHVHQNGSQSKSFFSVLDFMSCMTVAKQPCNGLIKIFDELKYCSLLSINVVCILWQPAVSNECHFGYHC
jgi:hypothetical protein